MTDTDDDFDIDSVPLTEEVKHPCAECGRDVEWKGRGRVPKMCPEHRKIKTTSTPRISSKNTDLAAQATGVLVQANGFLALALSALSMFQTGGAIVAGNDQFKAQAYEALLLDPDLCRSILKTGGKSAKAGLIFAYAGLGMGVLPTAAAELKELRAAKAAAKVEEDGTGA